MKAFVYVDGTVSLLVVLVVNRASELRLLSCSTKEVVVMKENFSYDSSHLYHKRVIGSFRHTVVVMNLMLHDARRLLLFFPFPPLLHL